MARRAIERKTGARGLRGIMEEILGPLMYTVPSDHTIERVVITRASVEEGGDPIIIHDPSRAPRQLSAPSKQKQGRPRNTSIS